MIVVGLTGGIACGKSTVSKCFLRNNIPIIDADELAREVVYTGGKGWFEIYCTWGKDYLNKDDSINREKLGELVFNNSKEMDKLNSIMVPLIKEASTNKIEWHRTVGYPIVVYDAALICEMGNADKYRPLIVVSCPEETQISRLIKRNNLTREQAQARINSQMPVAEKVKLANFVIDTSGSLENSERQTLEIISKLMEML